VLREEGHQVQIGGRIILRRAHFETDILEHTVRVRVRAGRLPGPDRESNWLPAPVGPIYLVMRLYWPTDTPPSILPPGKGTWQPPAVVLTAH
jgi:hypothetical protein